MEAYIESSLTSESSNLHEIKSLLTVSIRSLERHYFLPSFSRPTEWKEYGQQSNVLSKLCSVFPDII